MVSGLLPVGLWSRHHRLARQVSLQMQAVSTHTVTTRSEVLAIKANAEPVAHRSNLNSRVVNVPRTCL